MMDATWLDRWWLARARGRQPADSADGIRTLQTSYGTMRVRDVGTATRTLVFVCDMPMLIEHHAELLALLRADFRVLCVELPGLGFSQPATRFDFSLISQAAAVREALESLAVRDCVLAFGCVGAYLAVMLAHELPEIVRGVVLMQAGVWEAQLRWAKRIDFGGHGVVATPYLGQLAVGCFARPIAKSWIHTALGRSELKAELAKRSDAGLAAGAGWALASLTQSYFGRSAPAFHPVQQDSLLVWGDRDRTHRKTDPSSALAYLPRGRLVRFERAGHFPELEEPEDFARLLRGFAA
jgi:pimeloyl-ACP methyl ester carboxylesterase